MRQTEHFASANVTFAVTRLHMNDGGEVEGRRGENDRKKKVRETEVETQKVLKGGRACFLWLAEEW